MFRGVPKPQREQAARELLARVGLSHRLNHFPSQMSGGQQQRVGIARAFISRPDIVFADEPTGNLDSKATFQVMDMICSFARDFHQTVILVSHDPEMASYAHHIVTLLDAGLFGSSIWKRRGDCMNQIPFQIRFCLLSHSAACITGMRGINR